MNSFKNDNTKTVTLLKKISNKESIITIIVSISLVVAITMGSHFDKREVSTNIRTVKRKEKRAVSKSDESSNNKAEKEDENSLEKSDSSSSTSDKYKDGEYTGKSKGYNGDIKVSVKIKDGKISTIDILENSDDKEYFDSAKAVISDIIKAQNTNVDSVSGATYSSNGILEAVQNALDSGV